MNEKGVKRTVGHTVRICVAEEWEGERLDVYLADQLEELSRSASQNLIKQGRVLVDGASVKASYRVKEGDELVIEVPQLKPVSLVPQNLPLPIIYQDDDLVVVEKPKGMVVHPAHGNWENTMVNALMYHIRDLSGINGELRPGIVHRLDKDTSGVMVVAKNDAAHRNLAEQIRLHTIRREYIALVHGTIQENLGSIEAPIGRSKLDRKKMAVTPEGRHAISNYEVIERYVDYTLVKVQLLTGRTHQIRVHFAYIKHPVVGDPLYGPAKKNLGLQSQALHAYLLGFNHPRSNEYMEFTSDMPGYMQELIAHLPKHI